MAQVTVDIGARVRKIDFNRAASDINRRVQQMGRDSGRMFGDEFSRGIAQSSPRVQAATIGMQRATDKLKDSQDRLAQAMRGTDYDAVVRASQRVTRAHADHDRALRTLRGAYSSFDADARNAAGGVSALTTNVASLGGAVSRVAGPAGMALLVAGIGQLAGVAAAASGAVGLLPGVLTAVGSAFGVVRLATVGFSDALENLSDPEKFAEALQQLSPNARQAATSIRELVPAFDELKNATQNAFFANIGPQLTGLANQFLPTIQGLTTGVAEAMNQAFNGVAQQLQSPQTQTAIGSAVDNIVQAFQKLAPAFAPLTDAFAELTSVGSSFLPEIAAGATEAAKAFADFIREASRSGDLQQWIATGVDMLKQMGPVVQDVVTTFMALAPIGERVMPLIVQSADLIAQVMPGIAKATAEISPLFYSWQEAINAAAKAIPLITVALKPVAAVVTAIADAFAFIRGPEAMAQAKLNSARIDAAFAQPAPTQLPTGGLPARSPAGPWESLSPADRWLRADEAAHPGQGPAGPGTYRRRDGSIGYVTPPSAVTGGPVTNLTEQFQNRGSGRGGPGEGLPVVPNVGQDPMSLLQGFPVSASLYGAAGSVLDSRAKVAQLQSDINALEKSNTATASEIQSKKNDLANAEREQYEAELRLNEAKQRSTEKFTESTKSAHQTMSKLGAGLDRDLGISRGIAGLADNLVRFIGNLATAPLQATLQKIIDANPNEGSGLIGIAAAQGAFGPEFTPQGIAASQASDSSSSTLGSTAAVPYGYGYPGDAALLANVPAGKYSQSGIADLTQGIGDCSSAVEDLVNILDGRPTAGRSMSTHNADQWLTEHGFVPGIGGPGDFRVGFNSGHMQATLPGGTPFNWGSNAAAANRGIGGTGAADPAFTSHYYRPMGAGPLAGPVAPTDAPIGPAGPIAHGPDIPIPLPVTIVGGTPVPGATPSVGSNVAPPGGAPGAPTAPTPAPAVGQPSTGAPPIGSPASGQGLGPLPGPAAAPMAAQSQSYAPTQQPAAPAGWQPSGSSAGGGGGILGAAAGAAAGMFPGGGAAAQIAMQMIQRTIQYGGEVAGHLAQGAMDALSVSDPDGGPGASLGDSWLGRLAGAVASAGPALPSSAGGQDKKQGQQKDQGQQQGQDPAAQQQARGGVHIENFVQAPNRQNVQQTANDLSFATAAAGMVPF
ncbi:hypothetical protein CQY20_31940 [Mycolicibacterium agri]|uniref:Tape measure protein n=1 Tax=Mycolicibacterium agri TaxID=36811 RepID=A0A2A7MNC0_MYCAG|nr:hypothetical protein CQY20_31940 [Mycolicibacterium agri]GFG49455.1 hypothetical protein MAGR_08960 [Mycolicibacterium agri]